MSAPVYPKIVVTTPDEAPPPAYSILPPPHPTSMPVPGAGMVRYDTMTSYCTNDSGTPVPYLPGQMIIPPGRLDQPFLTKCPFCHAQVTTRTKGRVGALSWLLCGLCVFVGCVAGCCLIPFCTRRFKNVEHSCPKCHGCIAIYKRL